LAAFRSVLDHAGAFHSKLPKKNGMIIALGDAGDQSLPAGRRSLYHQGPKPICVAVEICPLTATAPEATLPHG